MSCAKHKGYEAKRAPTSDCGPCWAMWRTAKHKRDKAVASLQGQAGAAMQQAGKLYASARIPYSVTRGAFGRPNGGICSMCGLALEVKGELSIIPHVPSTCPGPAAKVKA